MLSSTLAKIGRLVSESGYLSTEAIDKFLELLSHYRKDTWIYPGTITRKLNIPIGTTYDLLRAMSEAGYLEHYYELYCSKCHKYSGNIVKTIEEIPEYFQCECCDSKMIGIENAVIVFKVVVE